MLASNTQCLMRSFCTDSLFLLQPSIQHVLAVRKRAVPSIAVTLLHELPAQFVVVGVLGAPLTVGPVPAPGPSVWLGGHLV